MKPTKNDIERRLEEVEGNDRTERWRKLLEEAEKEGPDTHL
jgi:hypothetical protein